MSVPINTDGMFTIPIRTSPITLNALESIESTIAFDVRDWSTDRRSAWIYMIVYGWDELETEIAQKYGWDAEDIKRGRQMHVQWVRMRELLALELKAESKL